MHFIFAVLAGILGAAIGLVAGWGVGEILARALNVSCFEGACGYFVALIALLGGVAGLVAGILAVLLRGRRKVPPHADVSSLPAAESAPARRHGLRTTGQFVAAIAVIIVAVTGGIWGYAWISDDSLGGHNQAAPQFQYEIRFPAGTPLPEKKAAVDVQLYTEKNQAWGDLYDDWRQQDGERPVIAGFFELYFRASTRVLSVKLPGGPKYTFILKLPRSPGHMTGYSDWYQADSADDGSGNTRPVTEADDVQIRYRVVYAGED
ncbi:MAG: hypothetical protein R3D43_00350 [Tepidamorphaceae bacterium]